MQLIIGKIGSDAGYTVIDDTGIHRVGVYGFAGPNNTAAPELAEAANNSLPSGIPAELTQQFKLDDKTVLVLV